MLDCYFFHYYEDEKVKYCQKFADDYYAAEANWCIKCKQFYSFVIAQTWHICG